MTAQLNNLAATQQVTVLETQRLSLRQLTSDDAQFLLELLNEPSFITNIGDRGVRTVSDASKYALDGPIASYARNGFGLYLVELKETGKPIGICGLVKRDALADADIGFAFLPAFWSQGYAYESALMVKAYALNVLKLKRVLAITNPNNAGSIRVLEKIGLQYKQMVRMSADAPEIRLYSSDVE
ncbi:MAG: GNAT family N-acetyltransferase [Acidobacteriota bacterium]